MAARVLIPGVAATPPAPGQGRTSGEPEGITVNTKIRGMLAAGTCAAAAPVCQTSQVSTPASLVRGLRTQDPGTKASVDGMVVRITGLVATFRGDGLPV